MVGLMTIHELREMKDMLRTVDEIDVSDGEISGHEEADEEDEGNEEQSKRLWWGPEMAEIDPDAYLANIDWYKGFKLECTFG